MVDSGERVYVLRRLTTASMKEAVEEEEEEVMVDDVVEKRREVEVEVGEEVPVGQRYREAVKLGMEG